MVVNGDCTAVFCATQDTVVTKWIADEVSWKYDIVTDLSLPTGGKTKFLWLSMKQSTIASCRMWRYVKNFAISAGFDDAVVMVTLLVILFYWRTRIKLFPQTTLFRRLRSGGTRQNFWMKLIPQKLEATVQ